MSELDKLAQYLESNGYNFKREDTFASEDLKQWFGYRDGFGDRHQIIVYGKDGRIAWDAIYHWGSYGYEKGLLEIMGEIVDTQRSGGDTVEGWMTAQDIIKRLETMKGAK